MFHMHNGIYITHSRCRPIQYVLLKEDVIELNPYAIQLFHRVQYIWLKDMIQATVFITVFALHPEAII